MAGPNDFHGEIIDGVWTLMPSLGKDEPQSAVATLPEPPKVQELRRQQAALDKKEEELRVLADKLKAQEEALSSVRP